MLILIRDLLNSARTGGEKYVIRDSAFVLQRSKGLELTNTLGALCKVCASLARKGAHLFKGAAHDLILGLQNAKLLEQTSSS